MQAKIISDTRSKQPGIAYFRVTNPARQMP